MEKIKSLFFICFIGLGFFTACEKEPVEPPKSSEKMIIAFTVGEVSAEINKESKQVAIQLPFGTDITNVKPIIKISDKAKIVPLSGMEQDFSSPVTYTITAEDGSIQEYTVSAAVALNQENDIITFSVHYKGREWKANTIGENGEIRVGLPYSKINRDSLYAHLQISDSASVLPASGERIDFSKPLIYTVKAQDGSMKGYKIIFENNENFATKFSLGGFFRAISSQYYFHYPEDRIGLGNNFFIFYVMSDRDISSIIPEFSISEGATTSLRPGVALNFNEDITFTVTAESGEVREYRIRVYKQSIMFTNESPNVYHGRSYGHSSYWITYYHTISPVTKVDWISEETGKVYPCSTKLHVSEQGNYLYMYPEEVPLPVGRYHLKVYLENGEEILTRAKFSISED